MSELPTFTIRELLESAVHYGHKTMRWNPKMVPYIYGVQNETHIIDLQKTAPLLYKALQVVYDVVKNNGRILFVGTKKQASELVAEAARRCGQYYVNHRWLGGMLTNWGTVSQSIKTLIDMENKSKSEAFAKFTKKEQLDFVRKCDKLECSLGGIKTMGGKPDLLFVIDTVKENLAIQEAVKLNIPIIAIIDTNSDPDNITYPVPGNDDATRALRMYCKLVSDAALAGIQASLTASGADLGASEVVAMNKGDGSEGEAPVKQGRTRKKTNFDKAKDNVKTESIEE
ncbi:Ribosomal protein S2 [Rickettsiales bacterium Ac37b]|nr:Ribosomal protein S2 [Rickettsiales bacterium Ac37b]